MTKITKAVRSFKVGITTLNTWDAIYIVEFVIKSYKIKPFRNKFFKLE